MKDKLKKIFNWLLISNRYKHLIYGSICTIIVFLASIILLNLSLPISLTSSIITIMVISALAVGMEFKDKMWGSEFDWLDLLATIILPIIIVIITIII